MADLGFDGFMKVSFVPTIANYMAPTVAELNAGISLECVLLPDGLTRTSDTAEIATSKMCSTKNSAVIGRDTFTLSVKYVRGDDDDAEAVETALVRGAKGYIVVRSNMLSETAWAASQKVEVYEVQCKRPNADSPAADTQQAVQVGFAVGDNVAGFGDFATVAAGA